MGDMFVIQYNIVCETKKKKKKKNLAPVPCCTLR
jgi:hypothetical protein